MVCHYILLFSIIRYYDPIMTLIAIIALIAQFSEGEVSIDIKENNANNRVFMIIL